QGQLGKFPWWGFHPLEHQLASLQQASEFACLPGRSHRYRFPCRAAEAFTSEPNVHRCLCTHRICYPPDYRQLAERGLTPRKIHSIVDCSSHFWGSLQFPSTKYSDEIASDSKRYGKGSVHAGFAHVRCPSSVHDRHPSTGGEGGIGRLRHKR